MQVTSYASYQAVVENLNRVIPIVSSSEAYFDLGPRKVTSSGTYFYFSTRNNAFTNRSQKGKIVVVSGSSSSDPGSSSNNSSDDSSAIKSSSDIGENKREIYESTWGGNYVKLEDG